MPHLQAARYGKDNIRVCKVERDQASGLHTVTEMTVCVFLEGQIETSYTHADNSVVVPTDTMKQTTYIMAKEHPVTPIESFGSVLSQHFLDRYPHISTASVTIKQHRWSRLEVDGQHHPHSFLRDGAETRDAEVVASRDQGISIHSALRGLLVLKSTGSAFHGFHTDEFTILKPTNDRIFSTEIDGGWTWSSFKSLQDVDAAKHLFDKAFDVARNITTKTFAEDNSASVQATMYKICEAILASEASLKTVDYSLPNKHYFEIDLSWHKGLKNTGADAEVYAPQTDPNGLIKCVVER